jgi:predicted phage tail component-like protein
MSLTYDGHDLESLFACGDPEITILNSIPDTESSSGRDGSIVIGRRWGDASVSFAIGASGTDAQRRAAFSTLGAWLSVDEPKQLVLPDTPDRYYLAIPDGSLDLERGIRGEMARLSFTLTDPIAYGEERTITIPSGRSANVTIGGTAAAMPYIVSAQSVTPNSSTKLYGLRLDDGDVFCLTTGGTGAFTVNRLDMGERVVYVNGALTLPTLDSDWLVLTPGTHKLRNHQGSGQLVLKYRERWL